MNLRSLLLPLNPVYRLGQILSEESIAGRREHERKLRMPVISIGNLSTGGAGKTPLAIALARALTMRGLRVDVLSRGYGRTSRAAGLVRTGGTAEEFGDEPLLIAREACVPVYVARQRYDAGLLAESSLEPGARAVHILDDGFQHRRLHRDIDIVLLSGRDLRDRLLPAGNLREPLHAIRRAHVIAIPAEEALLQGDLRNFGWQGPVWRLQRRMEIPQLDGPVLGFCGIARPEQFFAGLEQAGVTLAFRRAFPDHHRYSARDLDRLARQARASGATALVTTEKDAVRLAGISTASPVQTVRLNLQIENETAALDWLVERLARAAGQ